MLGKYFISVLFLSLMVSSLKAEEASKIIKPDPVLVKEDNNLKIFQVRRALALKDSEVNKKEFYINGGTDQGLKAGFSVEVTRRNSFYDALRNQTIGDMLVPVGRVKIVFSSRSMSVARIDKVYSADKRPSLEYETFLVGDRLDVSTLKAVKTSHRVKKRKRKVASVKKKKPVEVELRSLEDEGVEKMQDLDPLSRPLRQ